MKSSTKNELQKLLDHIKNSYAGDYAAVSRDLDKAIYCLHFLKKKEVPREEVEDLCFALHKLSECFYRAHSERRIYRHQELMRIVESMESIWQGSEPSP